MATNTFVLDNGASNVKWASSSTGFKCKRFPNGIFKAKTVKHPLVGDQLLDCTDFSQLYIRSPFERGILTNWDIQKIVWDRLFSEDCAQINPSDTALIITEPVMNLPNVRQAYDEIIFEEYQFHSALRATAPFLASQGAQISGNGPLPAAVMVVDTGHSFSHAIPFVMGKGILRAIRRVNVGGKLLTNQMKEVISFRHYNMMEETHLVNEIKERCCIVSSSYEKDLAQCKRDGSFSPFRLEYVLPDYNTTFTGSIRADPNIPRQPDEQVLVLGNERFAIPEILFRPSDIGIEQGGIAEAIADSISLCPDDVQEILYANIIVVGGNALFPGFKARLESELRNLAPIEYDINITIPQNPIDFACESGSRWCESDSHLSFMTLREDYDEYGSSRR
ncbi:actin-like protein ARP6 [Cladochytrium replicatum]|nr:actin-like protein ARP6 [Cladochytrium replicatum]